MIRILQIGMGPNPGGIENCIMNYYRKINHERYQFDFVDIYGRGLAFEEEIKKLGGVIYHLANYKKHPLKTKKQLEKVLDTTEYDIIHINMLSAANLLPVYVCCKDSNARVIVHSHNSAVPSGIIRRIMNDINIGLLRKAPVEKWACGVKAGIWMWGQEFQEKNIVPNAVDVTLFSSNDSIRKKIRQKCGFKESDKVIGFVGRIAEQKNPLFLLEIIRELRSCSSDYKLLVLGEGEMQDALIDGAREKGVDENIVFAGVQYNIYDWYKAMDAFVLPSLFEGLPVVGIEAQASGLACFLSNNITTEVNVSKTVQYLPINQGAKIWAERIVKTLENKVADKVELPQNYHIQYAVQKLERTYDELVSKK